MQVRIFLVLALFVAFFAIIFALQNSAPIIVTVGVWRITASLALILLITLGLGFISGLLVSMPTMIQRNWQLSRSKRQMGQLQTELEDTKQELVHQQNLLAQARHELEEQQTQLESQRVLPGQDSPKLLTESRDIQAAEVIEEAKDWIE